MSTGHCSSAFGTGALELGAPLAARRGSDADAAWLEPSPPARDVALEEPATPAAAPPDVDARGAVGTLARRERAVA
jgi:hypothetical protein